MKYPTTATAITHASANSWKRRPTTPISAPVRSMIAAVPYATTSAIVWPSSEESNRIMTTALAPIARAFSTIRSMACRRVSSTILVYSTISPPAIDRRPAMMLPPRPRLRTTTPKTWPRAHFTSEPAGRSVVVTSTGERCGCWAGAGCCMPLSLTRRAVRRSPENQHAKVLVDVVESVLHPSGDENQAARLHRAILARHADSPAPADHVVDLVFLMGLLAAR